MSPRRPALILFFQVAQDKSAKLEILGHQSPHCFNGNANKSLMPIVYCVVIYSEASRHYIGRAFCYRDVSIRLNNCIKYEGYGFLISLM